MHTYPAGGLPAAALPTQQTGPSAFVDFEKPNHHNQRRVIATQQKATTQLAGLDRLSWVRDFDDSIIAAVCP